MTTFSDPDMQRRVMSQLCSRPAGWQGTAAEIAAGMDGKLEARQIEPTLRLFWQQNLVGRSDDGKRWHRLM